jgi:diadenylate cyclase
MHLLAIIADLRFQDLLDIIFLTVVAYHLYIWFQGTKAFKALVGLLVLGAVYTAARTWGLFLTTWVFQILWQVVVILLIILFQSEIRQVLERVNPLGAIGLRRLSMPVQWAAGFSKTIFSLAARKIGALVIIERVDRVQEWVTEGQPLDGDPSLELLVSIFQKDSLLHDGAVLIRGGRVSEVACYLPLSPNEGLPKEWGTRHRAALGLSERCDAWVIVVSEERGEVSLARGGQMAHAKNQEDLSELVLEAITPLSANKKTLWDKARFFLGHRWRTKLVTLALVSFVWLLLAGQQDFEVTFSVPLEIKNLSAGVEVLEPVDPKIEISVRGLRKDASTLSEKNVLVEIGLSGAREGRAVIPITRDDILLPNDRIQVVKISPPRIEFFLREKLGSTKRNEKGKSFPDNHNGN